MLSIEQVASFLQHEDHKVREHVVAYFVDAHDPGPVNADDFWAVIDRFGMASSIHVLSRLDDVPQTPASIRRALDALRAGADELFDFHLQQAVQNVDFATLLECRDEILACEQVLPHVREHLAERLRLVDATADDAWDGLLEHSEASDKYHVGEFDARIPGRLVEALARHGDAAGARALHRLQNGPTADWMEIHCVEVLDRLRYAPATDTLVRRLEIDADFLRDRVVDALSHIGTLEVVGAIEAFYPGKPWHVRLYADDPLARIKRPESEAALLRLLEVEADEDLRTGIAMGLCDLCTTEGLDAVHRLIVEDRYDPQMADLREMLLIVGTMVGYEPPEGPRWREEIAREDAERERRLRTFSGVMRDASMFRENWRRDGYGSWSDPELDRSAVTAIADLRDLAAVAPVRRTDPKVGRNDPCPCGSGKKYKKCCLNAETG